MTNAGERRVGLCPGCGYPVIGPQPCAVCAPLLTAAHAEPSDSVPGPIVAA
ncbi:hypothetical protein [Mycolicibacterium bacteremicum]|uniref:hypothetical protein n=1 Tax=Mycolicibacterium bacteremicum TaxID=564198 RepID=UPI0013FDD1F5|nr:hypothetical protein [Mycolicibacterium bacteremicum]MCV7433403.1 hypothetical protein [Mycolicibacterium bacteremicum]